MLSDYLANPGLALTAILSLLQGDSDPASKACQLIQQQLPSVVSFPASSLYSAAIVHNSFASQQNAKCVVEPSTPEEVSTILQIIGREDLRAPFAIKSGGHAFNPGHSSSSGVQISLTNFNHIDYDEASKTVRVGTGITWDAVYRALEPHGVNVVGGRVNDIGVGGFATGGGWSWKSNQYGLTIDTITAFDVVTPTGKIVHATDSSESDLFWGLKGGLNNFGVVTSVTLETHPQTEVFGGLLIHTQETIGDLNKAVAKFNAKNKDPKAQLLCTYMNVAGQLLTSLQIFYDGPTPPKGMFDELLAVPAWQGQTFTAPFTAYLNSFDVENPFKTISWIPDTLPISEYNLELLDEMYAQVIAVGNKLQSEAPQGRFVTVSFTTEPMVDPFKHSRGGAYPHKAGELQTPSYPFMWYTTNVSTPYETEMDIWNMYSKELKAMTSTVREKAIKLGVSKDSDPLYGNYAHGDTDVELIFRENLPRLREIAAKYDPEQVMLLTDGFLVQKGWKKDASKESSKEEL